jgi:hypothetical protein
MAAVIATNQGITFSTDKKEHQFFFVEKTSAFGDNIRRKRKITLFS